MQARFADAGVPIDQLHAEYGADQFEISLAPADPLLTADRTVLARILIGRAAARYGLGVSFSPVPFAGGAGNGAHLHLSLADAGGPLLSGGTGPYGMTHDRRGRRRRNRRRAAAGAGRAGRVGAVPAAAQARQLGGCVRVLGAGEPGGSGPVLRRRRAGNPHGASVELKCIDGSANPYLAATALLGLALDGIEQELPLPPEVTVDPATLPQPQRERLALAASQTAALDALQSSPLARSILGESIVDATLAVRRYEHATYGDADPQDVAAVYRLAFSC